MKKILLLASIFIFTVSRSFSQCIPDTSITHNEVGIYPDSATGLPHAVVGTPYSEVIQLKVLTDTSGVTVDSVDITGVAGLPSGFTYQCTPSSCHFPGGSDACILLTGPAPTTGMAGQIYPLTVGVSLYGHLGIIPVNDYPANITRYRLVVDPANGISFLTNEKLNVLQNVPNPFNKTTEISFYSPAGELLNLKISNLLGKVIYTQSLFALKGLNKITLSSKDFNPGIYIYSIGNSKAFITKRMIVSNE
jgi:hypothetical protein